MNGKELKIKVCGMKHQQNVDEVVALGLDFIGNIFFAKSPRNIEVPVGVDPRVYPTLKKVGVFVKESIEVVKSKIEENALEVIQLHGGESNDFCKEVKDLGVEVWKVFSVGEDFDFSQLKNYPDADMFLFDTKTENHGGAGRKFDWSLLDLIDKESPKTYFLAGGIGPGDAQEIKSLNLEKLIGLDLNSKFEIEPGLKDVNKLKEFLNELRK